MSRIGILGGTFNPIHNGHIQMAKYSHDAAKLDKVILMPTFVPPHKESLFRASTDLICAALQVPNFRMRKYPILK